MAAARLEQNALMGSTAKVLPRPDNLKERSDWICKNGESPLTLNILAGRITGISVVFVWVLYVVLCDFVVGLLTDERIRVAASSGETVPRAPIKS